MSARLVAGLLQVSGIKKFVFAPRRFTDPKKQTRRADKYTPPRSLSRHVGVTQHLFQEWPVYTLTPRSGGDRGLIVFLHGGAYAEQILNQHWALAAKLAEGTDRRVVVPIYPLSPRHTHRDVFAKLIDLYGSVTAGVPPADVALVGDSAGGGMALALAQALWGNTGPADLVLYSPWLDATMSNPVITDVAPRDPLLNVDHVRTLGRFYAGADEPSHPRVSPLNGPLTGLGRVLVFAGTRDVLTPDARRFKDLAEGAGVDLDYREYAGLIHDWVVMPVAEAREVVAETVAWLNQRH
jgi:epsilon-lactone hydrolase